ncbi:DegT/DnrJ/EryC1/StrS family aminotransferase [Streptomyces sp. NPDC050617]|uniref:DegT/DnrJ/EryC1/StrS family aminotransferase n=1 Tax=Streptomyces sp. NPDC050617 TaxID=3154628 RepID=UPI0034469106
MQCAVLLHVHVAPSPSAGMGTLEMLRSAGVGAGDEVIVPSYATAEAAEAVRGAGAVPVFADIDAGTFCLDASAVAAAVTPRTAAVVPVPLFGHPVDMAALRAVGERRSLLVVEHGEEEHEGAVARRRQNAAYLTTRLNGLVTPTARAGVAHAYRAYVVRVPGNGRPDRDAFARTLRARGVRCQVPVQTPVHRMPAFARDVWLAETERAADECLALPVDETMTRRELHRVVSACNALGGLLEAAA